MVPGMGCPKGSPDAGIELTDQNWLAYQFHQECKAVGRFPGDPIVRRNAAIIESVERDIDRSRQRLLQQQLSTILSLVAVRR